MSRLENIFFSLMLMAVTCPFLVLISLFIKISSPNGSVLYWSDRVGQYNKIFSMPKFRTMKIGAPNTPTHLLENPHKWIIVGGGFLRSTSLDELPQLWSIFLGDMNFVGPRPALFSQDDLIKLRQQRGVSDLVPGITGWAQINGRDDNSVEQKVALDTIYLKERSRLFDYKIIFFTLLKIVNRSGVCH